MQMDLTLLTALAVMVHLGTTIASVFLKDKTDQAHIATLNTKVDQVLGVVTAIAPAIPASAPKTLNDVASDLAAVAQALAAATSMNPPAPNSGGVGGVGGNGNAG